MSDVQSTTGALPDIEKEIAAELRRPIAPVGGWTTGMTPAAQPNKVTTAMRNVDVQTLHEDRAIEAALQEAIVARIMQVRGGRFATGPYDVFVKERALEWIMSITADNADEMPKS